MTRRFEYLSSLEVPHIHNGEKIVLMRTVANLPDVYALVKCIILYDDKIIITTTFKNEPITIMTTEEVADVARLGSDINSLAPPKKKRVPTALFSFLALKIVSKLEPIDERGVHPKWL